jgi:LacI family transcriptional regulator
MAVTLKNVAEKAGVAVSTVSMIIGGKSNRYGINKETARKVRDIASKLDYRPSASALALLKGSVDCIGVFSASKGQILKEPFYAEMFCAIENQFHDHNINTMTLTLELKRYDGSVPKMFRERFIEGALIVHYAPKEVLALLQNSNLPRVYVNMGFFEEGDTVNPNEAQGMRDAVEYLFGLGHRRIIYLGKTSKFPHHSMDSRRKSFTETMRSLGMEPCEGSMVPLSTDPDDIKLMHQLKDPEDVLYEALLKPDRPTAVIVYHDNWLGKVLRAIEKASLKVPSDVNVITFGESEFSRHITPNITHVNIPFREMGVTASDILYGKIRRNENDRQTILLPEDLIIKESTCRLK